MNIRAMRLREFYLRLADGARGQRAAYCWYNDALLELESTEPDAVYGAAFINVTVKRARDDEVLTKSLAASPMAPTPKSRRPEP